MQHNFYASSKPYLQSPFDNEIRLEHESYNMTFFPTSTSTDLGLKFTQILPRPAAVSTPRCAQRTMPATKRLLGDSSASLSPNLKKQIKEE